MAAPADPVTRRIRPLELALKIAFGIVVAYLALIVGMYLIQRSMMYFPAQTLPTPDQAGVPEMRTVELLTDDGLTLTAWYRPAAEENGVEIIYFHGNGGHIGHRVDAARELLEAGFGLLLVGYRGYGGNPGKPTEEGFFADSRAAYDFLAARSIDPRRIALIGESLGSGVAVYLASQREVGAVLLQAPFTSAADVGQKAYPFLPVHLLMKDPYDSASRIKGINAPLLIVHGERDRVVPASLGRRLLDAANEPKEGHFLPDADHNDLHQHGITGMQIEFLGRHLGS